MSFCLELTIGAIQEIQRGTLSTGRPILQVLKLSQFGTPENYRCLLSDGVEVSCAIFSQKAKSYVTEKRVAERSIIKLISFENFNFKEQRSVFENFTHFFTIAEF
jgi:hypothetical protein